MTVRDDLVVLVDDEDARRQASSWNIWSSSRWRGPGLYRLCRSTRNPAPVTGSRTTITYPSWGTSTPIRLESSVPSSRADGGCHRAHGGW
ncbi:hypothetical protein [Amycolatopsis sp. YIM 10]|uniref:hypothetical protein n=1 Tax=Amycolatopsis sp. YIM 10 TaxID=2653857 RepID=UPI00128FFA91|nr:hypothetical protein [Amycolatopsis sp. YIM 10]QFU90110.1 hypothetical protein YIM_24665 [Amycolatopsis sp. YIM 10]